MFHPSPGARVSSSLNLIALAVLSCQGFTARGQFGTARIIERTETAYPNRARPVDVDADGDLDLLVCSMGTDAGEGSGGVGWLVNDGTGQFEDFRVIDAQAPQASDVDAADFDGDGDVDVVASVSWNDVIMRYENLGAGAFGPGTVVTSLVNAPRTVKALDMDGDGDVDLASGSLGDDKIAWYANDGTGNLGAQQVMALVYPVYTASFSDLDGDGDVDILSNSIVDDQIVWFENDGSVQFGAAQVIGGVDGANHACAADIDGDGDNDVVATSAIVEDVRWYANDGSGGFGSAQIISPGVDYGKFVSAADMDGDGDIDVLSASSLDDKIAWYANDGSGGFGTQQIITTDADFAQWVGTGDLDGDGDLDVVSTSWYDDKVAWYTNDGAGGFGPQIILTTSTGALSEVAAADIDGDGDPDVVAGSRRDGKLSWYENLGSGMTGPQRVITRSMPGVETLAIGDLDGDQDPDVVAAYYDSYQQIGGTAWCSNDGAGNFAPQQQLSGGSSAVAIADMDGDGDNDVLNWELLLNDGSGTLTPSGIIFGSTTALALADLDLDGDVDVVRSGTGGSLTCSFNNGSPSFSPSVQITTDTFFIAAIRIADLNGDGWPDVASASAESDMIAWYANDGAGGFGSQQVIDPAASDPASLRAADLDNDGDQDLYAALSGMSRVVWYANDGSGLFGPPLVLTSTPGRTVKAWAADLDGDGDQDMIAGNGAPDVGWGIDLLTWHENHLESPYRITGRVFNDLDQDGQQDPEDGPFPWAELSVTPLIFSTLSNGDGDYTAFVDTGTFTVEAQLPGPLWTFTTDPPVQTVEVTDTEPVVEGIDFGIAPLVDTTIILPTLTLSAGAPCGFTGYAWISYSNQGTRVEQGTVTLELDTLFPFVSSEPPPTSILGNTITWAFDSLGLFGIGSIALVVTMPLPETVGTPWQNSLVVETVNDMGDVTGTFLYDDADVVTCAYDPNDKVVLPAGEGEHHAVPIDQDWLDYTVRFQNTGTDTAFHVLLIDRLSADLDWSSMEILGTSHPLTHVFIEEDGDLNFRYDHINLPDSGADMTGSNGYIRFRMRPLPDRPNLTEIHNTAEIYFDQNEPVITNTTLTTLVDCGAFTATITQLDVDLLQASEGEAYQWYLDDEIIPGATSRELLVTLTGSYSVEVTNDFGCALQSDELPVVVQGVHDAKAFRMAVIPNPMTDFARVLFDRSLPPEARVELVDVHGRVVRTTLGNSRREMLIQRGQLESGLYIVRVTSSTLAVMSARLIVP